MHATTATPARRSARTHRWIRQLHLWIGAWGALAAIVYGGTGLVLNNRFGDNAWPQGDSAEAGRNTLAVPAEARATPEQLSLWLRQSQGLDAQQIRKSPPGNDPTAPQKWSLSGGSARDAWSVDYVPGKDALEVKHTQHTFLAALNRMHKGVGGGLGWHLLADSFALCMVLLGISGLYMWGRGRTMRDMLVSVLGVSVVAFAVIVVPALI